MKRFRGVVAVLMLICSFGLFVNPTYAEGEETDSRPATSISISPVNKILKLEPSKSYKDSFKVINNGSEQIEIEVYASPYSYTLSEDDHEYKLGFSQQNSYTQITRWITFRDTSGDYVKNPHFVIAPGTTFEIHYKIKTPSSIPDGGQYAVIFAHTLSKEDDAGGLRTEASPGLVIYGRSSGETVLKSEIYDLKINKSLGDGEHTINVINGTAKVNNSGNVDFMAYGKLTVSGIFGHQYYVTPESKGTSIIPEVELSVSDKWDETPYFGLFRVNWSVTVGTETQQISRIVLLLPAPIIILMILLLTIIVIWIMIMVRKRKERRSRFGTV
ncbi:hypothetical protein IJS18_02415 [Candidatus Saccharibacteria bacterium]|nr:hypothetical protein [Candidatus Saccharibacteria bacterium]